MLRYQIKLFSPTYILHSAFSEICTIVVNITASSSQNYVFKYQTKGSYPGIFHGPSGKFWDSTLNVCFPLPFLSFIKCCSIVINTAALYLGKSAVLHSAKKPAILIVLHNPNSLHSI